MPDCLIDGSFITAIDESRIVTALLESKGGVPALLLATIIAWELLVKPLYRMVKGRTNFS